MELGNISTERIRRNTPEGAGENRSFGSVVIVNNEQIQDVEEAGPEDTDQLQTEVYEECSEDVDTYIPYEFVASETTVTTPMADAESTCSFAFEIEQDSNNSNVQEFQLALDNKEDKDGREYAPNGAEERRPKEKFNVECLSYELQVGYRILSNLMSTSNRCVNKLFLYPVDDTFPETADYYEKIKKPMWMFKMKEKFEKQEYNELAEFMSDFRLMIENCYRYNGPDSFVSKKAQKLELMMKQKVALLSRDLRDKITSSAAHPDDDILASAGLRRRIRNPNASSDDPSQQLLSQLRRDREMREKVDRRQKVEDRKAMEQARIQELQMWEDTLLGPEVKEQIRTMWELPQIGLFVYLCMESLGLEEEVTQYQIERGLAIPRECSDFKRLMTCLLSTPHQRKSLKCFMPYSVWNAKLITKLDYFYKVLSDNNGNEAQTCFVLGLDTRAFKVMGKCNPLLKKKFHQLSFLKRVWILKGVCDFCMETQPYLQKTVEDIEAVRPMDVREVQLGSDGRGNRYINFPMFTGKDIRIYRHSKYPEPTLESLNMKGWSVKAEKLLASSTCTTPVSQRNNRHAEPSSVSQKARALLQTVESKEASPMREAPRPTLDTPDTNTPASNPCPPSSNMDDSARGKQATSKKRKRTGLFFSRRKRIKQDKKGTSESKGGTEKPDSHEEQGGSKDAKVVAEVRIGSAELVQNGCERVAEAGTSSISENANISNGSALTFGFGSKRVISVDTTSPASGNNPASSRTGNNCMLEDSSSGQCSDFPNKTSSPDCDDTTLAGVKVEKSGCNDTHDEADNFVIKDENGFMETNYSSSTNTDKFNDFDGTERKAEASRRSDQLSPVKSESKTSNTSTSVKQELSKLNGNALLKQESKNQQSDCKTFVKRESTNNTTDSVFHEVNSGDTQSKDLASIHNSGLVIKEEIKSEGVKEDVETEEEDSDNEDLPDLGEMELVAESMEEIRQLINKLSNPEPTKRGKRVIPGTVKPCEEDLVAALSSFLEELTKYERSLANARLEMQAKLRKDVDNYVEPKVEEAKDWESEHSQSSEESSEDEDSDVKPEVPSVRQTRKTRQKPLTPALLSSAASKLSSITGEGNEDSNDGFELDISSRGRLRKRRIIPNNTEDTGLKRRKNLPNQELFFSSPSAGSTTTTPTTATQVVLPSIGKQMSSNIVSLLTSTVANTAIKAQLASQASRGSGQIVRLLAPASDGTLKTLHVGKPGMILSSQNLSNIRFVTSTGIVGVPRNRVVTSSSAQISHPVIQQMLLNQTKPSQHSTFTAPVYTTVASNRASGLPSKHPPGARLVTQAPSASVPKSSLVITAPSVVMTTIASKPSLVMVPQPAAAGLVQEVSASVPQGHKQVLDLGSLSVTQLQQLMKNQAIQIKTGAGGQTTLLLTSGLQQLATTRFSGAATARFSGAVTTLATGTTAHVRLPVNQTVLQHRPATAGTPSLVTMISNSQAATTSNAAPNNRLIPLLTSRQGPPQMVRAPASMTHPQTHVKINIPGISQTAASLNQGLYNVSIQTSLAGTTSLVSTMPGTVLVSAAQPVPVSINSGTSTVLNVALQNPISSPRIINSLASTGSGAVTLGASSHPIAVATTSNPWTVNPDALRSRIITVPLVHLSPSKKYANNVTVKALLENRGTKKCNEEDFDALAPERQQSFTNGTSSDPTQAVSRDTSNGEPLANSSTFFDNDIEDPDNGETFITCNNTLAGLPKYSSMTADSYMSGQAHFTTKSIAPDMFSNTVINPLTLPLSVDTAISSMITNSGNTSEIILPTMNIKVPSPTTLPSLQHNKNGTTIVQSTKVPIPMVAEAKTGGSLSPSVTVAPVSVHQGATLQTASVRIQPAVKNLVVIPASSSTSSIVRAVNPSSAIPGTSQLTTSMAGLKNILLKVTPQGSGSGQLVQGYVTSRGLVIPQSALLQQNHTGGTAILASNTQPGALTHIQPGNVQIQPSSVLGAGKQHAVLNFNSSHPSGVGQPVQEHQLARNVVVATPSSLASSNLSQGTNPSLKVVVVKAPSLSTAHPVSTSSLSNQQQQTSTPASELVKQIASNSQLQTGSQHKMAVDTKSFSPGGSHQNAVQLLNNIVHGAGLQRCNTVTGMPVVNVPTTIIPQLAAQILALQQNSRLPQQSNIVLTAKSLQNQLGSSPSQNKHSVVTLQVPQLGQLLSNLSGGTQLQVGETHKAQVATSFQQQLLGPRVAQPNQVFQLAICQPSGSRAIVATAPNPSQVVCVTGQLSPQLQLTHQGVTQVQSNGNIVIQQQPNQGVLIQPVAGSNTISIQPNSGQLQMTTLQQQLSKASPQHSIQRPQATTVSKVQLGSSALTQSQQLLSTSQIMSQLQAPTASAVTSNTLNQHQYIINHSASSLPTLSIGSVAAVSPSVNKIQLGSLTGAGNTNHGIRAESTHIPTNMNLLGTSIMGLPSPNELNHTMTASGSQVTPSTLTAKSATHLTISNSRTGQVFVSPVKINNQNLHGHTVNPLRFVSTIHNQSTSSFPGQISNPVVVNNVLSHTSLANLHNQLPVKPAVIYASQSSLATDKKDGKIAQILLSQPPASGQPAAVSNPVASMKPAQVIVSNHLSPVPQVSSSGTKPGVDLNSSLTYLYKIGDHYFSPASNLDQLTPQASLPAGALTTAGTVTAVSKPDVQLLVPPAFIEASDQMLKQSIKSQASLPQMPSSTANTSEAASFSINLNENPGLSQGDRETNVRLSQDGSDIQNPNTASVNGIAQGTNQFSFSLSGPVSTKKPLWSVGAANGSVDVRAEMLPSVGQQNNEPTRLQSYRPVLSFQNQHSTAIEIPSARSTMDRMAARRNTFNGSQGISSLKRPVPQRPSSSNDSAFSLEEQDEKEAALNLLTLANQQI